MFSNSPHKPETALKKIIIKVIRIFFISISISVQAVHALIKKWTQAINLKGNYGTHTLRKTWGYQQRVKFGVGFDLIAKRYNHTDPKTTMVYLRIEDKEVHSVLMNEIG
jgi:integrase